MLTKRTGRARLASRIVFWVGTVCALLLATFLATAPDVAKVCDHVLSFDSGHASGVAGHPQRATCIDRYRRYRDQAGSVGFAASGWCIRWARSVDEVGRCL